MPVTDAIWINGNISYCDTPKKFHGNPVRNRPTTTSRATQTSAQERVHRRRCPQLSERSAATENAGRNPAGICNGESFAASLDSALTVADREGLIVRGEEGRFRGGLGLLWNLGLESPPASDAAC